MSASKKKDKDADMKIFVLLPHSPIWLDGAEHGMVQVELRDNFIQVIAGKRSSVVFLRQE